MFTQARGVILKISHLSLDIRLQENRYKQNNVCSYSYGITYN